MTWTRRRTVLTLTVAALAAGGAGAIALGTSLGEPEQVGPVATATLGSSFTILEDPGALPEAPNSAGAAIAANPRAAMPDAAASPARRLAVYGNAGLVMMPGSARSERVCFMTTGLRHLVRCTDAAQLGNGRTVLSVPLVPETASTITTTRRVDFFIVPDEVTSVMTADGPASIESNVATVERPKGGPMGTVEFGLSDGRRVSVEFATAGP